MVPSQNKDEVILSNTFTGNCLLIHNEVAKAIKQKKVSLISDDDKLIFQKTGILGPNNYEEDRIFSYVHEQEKYSSKIVVGTVLLTLSCNLKCTYWFQGHDNPVEMMNKEQANRLINFLTLINLIDIKKKTFYNKHKRKNTFLFFGKLL